MAGWARDAAAYCERCAPRSISYGPGLRNTIDLFPGDDDGPIVVFIHGGYWQAAGRFFFHHLSGGVESPWGDRALPRHGPFPRFHGHRLFQQVRTAARE